MLTEKLGSDRAKANNQQADARAEVIVGVQRHDDDVDMTDSDDGEDHNRSRALTSDDEDHVELADVFQQHDYLQLFKNGSDNAEFRKLLEKAQ